MNPPSPAAPSRVVRTRLFLATGCAAAATAIAWGAGAAPSPAELAAEGSLALAQVALLLRAQRERGLRLGLLAATLQGLLAAERARGLVALALVLMTLVSALLALRALAHEAAGAALASRLPRSGSASPARGWTSAAGTLALAVAVLLLAPLPAALVDAAASALARLDPRRQVETVGAPTPERVAVELPGTGPPAAREDDRFPAALEWASASPVEDDTPVVVLRRTPEPELEAPFALHVRGRVLERFTETGLGPRPLATTIALDGRRDAQGWSPLAEPGGDVHEFVVEQVPLRIGDRPESLLFAPAQAVALDCPGALLRGDAELSAPLSARERVAFRVRSVERLFEAAAVPAESARLPATRMLELPPASRELETIRALAREVTRGAADDRERVARVLAFFRREFAYEPRATGIAGLAGLVDFLERRAGSCTHYAAAAALMLRTLGLSTRVATGFLALPTDDGETYLATLRNGHAWFEVAFEGLGWVTCDATPGGSTNPVLALAPEDGAGWLSSLTGFFGRFLGGEGPALRELVRALGWQGVLALLAGLALAALGLALRARRPPAALASTHGPPSASGTALERLLVALARAGRPRPATRTLREHGLDVLALDGPGLAPLSTAVDALYRARFGAARWSERDEDELARALAALASLAEGRARTVSG